MKIAVNGFGRIGRVVMRQYAKLRQHYPQLEIVAINDLAPLETSAFLLSHDSTFGAFPGEVKIDGTALIVSGQKIQTTSVRNPKELPWKSMGVDLVFDCTGMFKSGQEARAHLEAGAKRVMISAPAKEVDATFVVGVNAHQYDPSKHHIFSNASCTTNCLAPMAHVLHQTFGIKHGFITTVHSYTNDQRLVDSYHSDLRRARAGACNMIPTTTGAAKAVGEVIPELKGKLDGIAVRVPTPNVSLTDLVAELAKDVSVSEVNAALKQAADGKLKGVLSYSEQPFVSTDFNGSSTSSNIDAASTAVIGGNEKGRGTMVKVLSWYDNESGFSTRMLDLANLIASKGF